MNLKTYKFMNVIKIAKLSHFPEINSNITLKEETRSTTELFLMVRQHTNNKQKKINHQSTDELSFLGF